MYENSFIKAATFQNISWNRKWIKIEINSDFKTVLQIKMASSPLPQNRRKNLDVKKLKESGREVTLLSGLDKFDVKFYGPKDTPYEG